MSRTIERICSFVGLDGNLPARRCFVTTRRRTFSRLVVMGFLLSLPNRVPSLGQVEHVPDRLLRLRHHRIMPGIYNLVRTLKFAPLSRNNLVDRVPTLRAEN